MSRTVLYPLKKCLIYTDKKVKSAYITFCDKIQIKCDNAEYVIRKIEVLFIKTDACDPPSP